jgi:hypothetical protein
MKSQNTRDLLFGSAFLTAGTVVVLVVPLIFIPGIVLVVVGARRLLRGWRALRQD